MHSHDIRWVIAGLFVIFLLMVAFSDLVRRRPRRRPMDDANRHMRHRETPKHNSWKANDRR